MKDGRGEYVTRFAREARLRDCDVTKATVVVTAVSRQHVSAGAIDEASGLLPADLRRLLEPAGSEHATGGTR
jgi:uncharacterized protein (DUF2267 family)